MIPEAQYDDLKGLPDQRSNRRIPDRRSGQNTRKSSLALFFRRGALESFACGGRNRNHLDSESEKHGDSMGAASYRLGQAAHEPGRSNTGRHSRNEIQRFLESR